MNENKEEYLALLRARLEAGTTFHAATKGTLIDVVMTTAETVWNAAFAQGVIAGTNNLGHAIVAIMDRTEVAGGLKS